MSLKHLVEGASSWRPSASLDALALRAKILKKIRDFFAERNVLEIETPLLCQHTVTDPYIQSIPVSLQHAGKETLCFLQTSPEYAMKRLLAAGSGAIYQICKAFRQDEAGRLHNPEFSMLEWYRPGFDHHALMQEMDELLQLILVVPPAEKYNYASLFQHYLNINPHSATTEDLANCVKENGIELANHFLSRSFSQTNRDTYLQLLLTHCIEPQLGEHQPCFIYDFPASQAALARIQAGDPPLASRFEVYFRGIELANGFHELKDANEQRKRFEENKKQRMQLHLPDREVDENLLAALEYGLPDCAGVALGIDRLIMLASKQQHIAESLSFDIFRA